MLASLLAIFHFIELIMFQSCEGAIKAVRAAYQLTQYLPPPLLQVVALFASDGAALQHHHQVAATQESFCRLLFR